MALGAAIRPLEPPQPTRCMAYRTIRWPAWRQIGRLCIHLARPLPVVRVSLPAQYPTSSVGDSSTIEPNRVTLCRIVRHNRTCLGSARLLHTWREKCTDSTTVSCFGTVHGPCLTCYLPSTRPLVPFYVWHGACMYVWQLKRRRGTMTDDAQEVDRREQTRDKARAARFDNDAARACPWYRQATCPRAAICPAGAWCHKQVDD